jgi:glyoxylase-like metal-dependent hydrolase (beta-lactamase superfamily II)
MTAVADANIPPVAELVITHFHPDHAGGAALFHEATSSPLSCHTLDREVIEKERLQGRAPIAELLSGGETRDLGGLTVDIIHAPGHTPGCLALYIPERGALIATDTVMGMSTTVLRPGEGDLRAYARTLEMFLEIGAKTIYSGHGDPITDPAKRIHQLIDHRLHREQELLAALAQPRTIRELREAIYIDLPEVRHPLAEAQVLTGLRKLIDDGAAREDHGRYALA